MEHTSNRRTFLMIIGVAILVIGLVGITYAFFNYTRTGSSNVIKVGRISFNTSQTDTITLLNVFPIDSTNARSDTTNTDDVVVNITGDTTYNEGLEYLVTVSSLTNRVGTKKVPIDILVSAANLGDEDADYFDNRGGDSSIYQVVNEGTIKNNEQLIVGYITKGSTGINGSVTIRAYLDKNKVKIADTYDGTESDNMGTTNEWVENSVVLTTQEWNSLKENGVSFQVKVEANEGIWIDDPIGYKKVLKSISNYNGDSDDIVWIDNMETDSTDDDIIYFSGSDENIDFNYVWYSGKLWRITAIYPDGTMKLITQNNITTIAYDSSSGNRSYFYTNENTTSYMYQWLNEEFYNTLYHASDFIDLDKIWDASKTNDYIAKLDGTKLINSKVGLLNNYEYYNSFRNYNYDSIYSSNNSYLNNGYYWWLMTYNSNNSNVIRVYRNGGFNNSIPSDFAGVRPSIYLKSNVKFTGLGTISSPYEIVGDKEVGATNELINTRLSGEYIKLKNGNNEEVFRIIGIENNKTKIILVDYAEDGNRRAFATNNSSIKWGEGTTTAANTVYTYLNNTYYPNLVNTYGDMFDTGVYFTQTMSYSYKSSICEDPIPSETNTCAKELIIGIPRNGEMFAAQEKEKGSSNIKSFHLITPESGNIMLYISDDGRGAHGSSSQTRSFRPTLHLKSTVKILSGSGTKTDPYVVGL